MKEQKKQRVERKRAAIALGGKKLANTHLDKYSDELKILISKLQDHDFDTIHKHSESQLNQKKSTNDSKNLIKDEQITEDERISSKIETILSNVKGHTAAERKEKLKMRLMNESQTYYQNNLNVFCNGLSLLSANSLECHGLVHQINGQMEEVKKYTVNVEGYTNFMQNKTKEMLDELKSLRN